MSSTLAYAVMGHATRHHQAPPGAVPGTELSDEELLVRYRDDGDREAFSELVHRYEKELFNYLRRFLGDANQAEDAFQNTFLQVHLKCDQYDQQRRVKPWLYTIATNQAIDVQRRGRRHRGISLDQATGTSADGDDLGALIDLVSSREAAPQSGLDSQEQREWVRRAVDALPETLRGAVCLVYYQGLKYREAADVLGIPVGTVKSRMHAAILKLNEVWTQQHPDDFEP